jgi:hypothetical protein
MDIARLHRNWEAVSAARRPWQGKTMAVFLSPGPAFAYAVADRLPETVSVGESFAVGPLLRAVVAPFAGYALVLGADRWQLWQGTDASTAGEVADAGGRAASWRRVLGELIQPLADDLRDGYLADAADGVTRALERVDPTRSRPLFVFADPALARPLSGTIAALGRPVEVVARAGEDLTRGPIARVLRSRLPVLGRERLRGIVERCGPLLLNGLASAEEEHVREAAADGAVRTLLFDYARVPAQLAVEVLAQNGTLWPLTAKELAAVGCPGPVLAELHHPVG